MTPACGESGCGLVRFTSSTQPHKTSSPFLCHHPPAVHPESIARDPKRRPVRWHAVDALVFLLVTPPGPVPRSDPTDATIPVRLPLPLPLPPPFAPGPFGPIPSRSRSRVPHSIIAQRHAQPFSVTPTHSPRSHSRIIPSPFSPESRTGRFSVLISYPVEFAIEGRPATVLTLTSADVSPLAEV